MADFTIGCDPEVFIRRARKTEVISAFGVVPGTKSSPHQTEHGAIQVDGMALEFNTKPVPLLARRIWTEPRNHPCKAFSDAVNNVLNDLKQEMGNKYQFVFSPVADFDPEYLAAQPEEARELGCDPDFSAYTLEPNPRPDGDRPFRTAAGHIHLGWDKDIPAMHPAHIAICADFVKMLDATVGLYMTIIDKDGARRRELYGKAGAFRPKSYGVEYRTPSNAWLTSRERSNAIYELCHFAVGRMTNGASPENVCYLPEEEMIRIIDEGDFVEAKNAWLNFLKMYHISDQFRAHLLSEIKKREAA